MDSIVRAIAEDRSLRVVGATTTKLVREACRRQEARGAEALVLSRAATSAALLATLAKEGKERVLVQWRTDGPLGRVLADAWGDGRTRVALERRLPAQHELAGSTAIDLDTRGDVGSLVGTQGHVVVTRDLDLGQQYEGSVEVETGQIDEDVERYLNVSEQLPSVLRTATVFDDQGNVVKAGGILVQTFPGNDPSIIDAVRETLSRDRLWRTMQAGVVAGDLAKLAAGGEAQITRATELSFHCPCGRSRVLGMLRTLGVHDLRQLADEQEITEIRCHFCGNRYGVTAKAVRELADQLAAETN